MKKAMVFCLIAVTVLMFSSLAVAGSNPAITTPPTGLSGNVTCVGGVFLLDLSWVAPTDTAPSGLPLTKYAVEVTVHSLSSDVPPIPVAFSEDITVAADLLALTDVDLTSLIPAGNTLVSVDATVKGMVTPVPVKKGSGFSSNNGLASKTEIPITACPE